MNDKTTHIDIDLSAQDRQALDKGVSSRPAGPYTLSLEAHDFHWNVTVVFLRHAHSQWNQENRFSGWSNPGLSARGRREARQAGRRLSAAGLRFDTVWRSLQLRTEQTAARVLAAMGHPTVPVYADWRLNERHYGALEGLDKDEVAALHGGEQLQRWRRGYHDRPPAMSTDDPRHPRFSPRYTAVPGALLPVAESLEDTERRVVQLWHERIAPNLAPSSTTLIVAHGNTLRALTRYLDGLTVTEVEALEIPTAQPLCYGVDDAGRTRRLGYMDEPPADPPSARRAA
jgi:2,3-bisphosphoglycerate-dependent phosphoglycerate mutase